MVEELLTLKVFVNRSKLRKQVLEKLSKEPQIAIFLAKELDKHRPVISQIFLDLTSKKLTSCLNPEDDRYRKYQITDLGKKVLKELK